MSRHTNRINPWIPVILIAVCFVLWLIPATWRQNELDWALTQAIGHGDPQIVRRLLDSGAHPDADMWKGYSWRANVDRLLHRWPDPTCCPVLNAALEHGDTASARLLLEHGADPNARAFADAAPLMIAAANAEPEMVKLLLERGAKVNVREPFKGCSMGMTPAQIRNFRGPTALEAAEKQIADVQWMEAAYKQEQGRGKDKMVLSMLSAGLVNARRHVPEYRSIVQMLKRAGGKE